MNEPRKHTIDLEKWEGVVEHFLKSMATSDPSDQARTLSALGEGPVVVVAGPTGSGKTALLNALVGFSLFPEGTDHTTPVPTVIRRGKQLCVTPLGPDGNAVPSLPVYLPPGNSVSTVLPNTTESTHAALMRSEDPEEIIRRRTEFWTPIFEAGIAGECVIIEATVPLSWLPHNLRLVDMPGYEGWFPEDNPVLHNLVVTWLQKADHAVFVMEKTKFRLGKASEFVSFHCQNGKSASLLISQVDELNPFQVDGVRANRPEAWDSFSQDVLAKLREDGIPVDEKVRVFFGGGKLRDGGVQFDWLEEKVLAEMLSFFNQFEQDIKQATNRWKESKVSEFQSHLLTLVERSREDFDEALYIAKGIFVNTLNVNELHTTIEEAIEDIDFSRAELLRPKKMASRLGSQIEESILAVLERLMITAMDNYWKQVFHILGRSIHELNNEASFKKFRFDSRKLALNIDAKDFDLTGIIATIAAILAGGGIAGIGSLFVVQTTTYLLIFTATVLNPIAIAAVIVGALVTSGFGIKLSLVKKKLRRKLKKKMVSKIDVSFLEQAWKECTKTLSEDTVRAVWQGIDTKGNRMKSDSGDDFPGLRSLLLQAFEESLDKPADPANG